MRKVRMILSWIAISLILQCTVLFFLDRFYFKDNTDVNMEKVDINAHKSNNNVHVNIPADAKDIKVSYDGKYVSYYMGFELNICNSETGEVKQLETLDGGNILKSVWLEDRNMLLTLEVEGNQVVLCNYDPQKNTNEKIVDICQYSNAYKTFDIKVSTITGVTYVQVGGRVYRIDINQTEAVQVPLVVNSVGDIGLMPTKDRLVYIAKNGKVVHITQPQERIVIDSNSNIKILDIDEDGNLYLGEMNGDKVTKIIKKNLDDVESKQKVIKLEQPVLCSNIYIDPMGNIYVNDSNTNTVKNIENGKELKYNGKFISFYKNGVTSLVDGKYYKTELSKQ